MSDKELLSLIAILLAIISYIPYYIGLYRRTLKPHLFTWLQWGLMQGIVFVAQLTEGGGAVAWIFAIGGTLSLSIAGAAIWLGEKSITRGDWLVLVTGLGAIPLWIVTEDPLWSVLIATFIDASAYIPTFRKSWPKPHEESMTMFMMSVIINMLVFFALEHHSVTTATYSLTMVTVNTALVLMLLYRRKELRNG